MRRIILLLGLAILAINLAKAQHKVNGYIKDAKTGESLIGANVWLPQYKTGTATNTYGFYSLTIPADTATMVVSYVGYQTESYQVNHQKDSLVNFIMQPDDELSEVLVKGSRPNVELTKMSSMTIRAQEIKKIPALMGETDVLKVIQLMPGIQSGSEGSSGIYVRGGGPDQNLILLDGVPVYNASHLFGFFSVFNADAINNVEVIKGGFPARYGGRLSSVIDINMKEGNMQQWQAEGGVGLIASRLSIEGPLVKDKASIILSARRTYIDILARPFIKAQNDGESDFDLGYFFYDFNGKANYIISERDRIYLSAYTGTDRFYSKDKYNDSGPDPYSYEDEAGIYWGNVTTALRWNHIINNALFLNTTASYSKYGFNLFNDSYSRQEIDGEVYEDEYSVRYNSGIQDYGIRFDFDYYPNNKHAVKFGVQYTYHIFQPEAFNLEGDFEGDNDIRKVPKVYGNEYMVYVEDEFSITDKLKTNVGLNTSAFYVNEEWYNSFQPRVSARYLFNPTLSVKASYAEMAQYLHLLTNSGIGLPTDLWVPVTENVKPQLSKQVAVGLSKSIQDNAYELTLESYYKYMQNLIEYKEGANFLNVNENWEDKIATGNGWSYGGELLLRKNIGKVSGWLGYTLSWNNRQFEELNYGEIYPYKYDRRHDISLVLNWQVSDRFELSGTWVYGTGNALTIPIATYPTVDDTPEDPNYNEPVYQYSDRNAYRMPAYHRADIGFSWHKQKKWGEATWNVSIYNLYNRQNPFYVAVSTDNQGQSSFQQYSLFQFIPSISYSFKIRPNEK